MKNATRKLAAIAISALMLCTNTFAGEIYVSTCGHDNAPGTKERPLRTPEQALKQAREWRRLNAAEADGGISIILEPGIYQISQSIFIRPEDSGTETSPTTICSADSNNPATISGGIEVDGWHKGCNDPRIPKRLQKKIWWADAPMNAGRIVETRLMWVNGKKAVRATQFAPGILERMKNFSKEEQTITIPTPTDYDRLIKASQLEMLVHQRWAIAILRVKSMTRHGDETVVRFHEPESKLEFAHPWPQPVIGEERGNSSFCLMNALELIDEPGEWYQDYPSGRIYYYPRDDEDMTNATATIPLLETLVKIDGNDYRQVRHINFKNIVFENSAWNDPSHEGLVTLQGGFPLIDAYKLTIPGLPEKAGLENQAWIKRPVQAVNARYAEDILFDGCTFRHMGATAVDMSEAVNNSSIRNCRLTDIGGTAIMIGTFPDGGFETHIPYLPKESESICSNIIIDNNTILEAANEDWGAVGIAAGYVRNTEITHNEVGFVNYSGICVGWGWTPLKSGMENNKIDCNFVHHFARQLYDVGGIYTLSAQPGSSIRNNRIEDLTDAPYATNNRAFYIYLDEATDGFTIENNYCPEERFDSNQPGPNNVWGKNGPSVTPYK
jgi:hypothetical protein